MVENPCGEEKARAIEAAQVWERASEDARRFVVEKPPEPGEVIEPKTPEFLEEMSAAFEREAKARDEYIAAMNAWFKCEEGTS